MARLHRLGWLLFLFSALAFLAGAVRDGDVVAVAASTLFLLGCVAFLWPER